MFADDIKLRRSSVKKTELNSNMIYFRSEELWVQLVGMIQKGA